MQTFNQWRVMLGAYLKMAMPMTRRTMIILSMIAVFGVFYLVVAVAALTGKVPDPRAPLVYSSPVYYPDHAQVCPNETITYTETYTIRDSDVRVSVYWFLVRNVDGIGYLVMDSQIPFRNISGLPQDVGDLVPRVVTPTDYINLYRLPAGHYEWRIFSQTIGRLSSSYFVPFELLTCG